MCVCVCARARARACVRACVCACVKTVYTGEPCEQHYAKERRTFCLSAPVLVRRGEATV